jgi:rod shape-determining protein MreB
MKIFSQDRQALNLRQWPAAKQRREVGGSGRNRKGKSKMLLDPVVSFFSTDLAIDLGTSNTLVYAKGKGIVVDEPSVVAVRKGGERGSRILAVGKEAKRMLGRTPGDIVAIRPLAHGVIADFEITEAMLKYFIRRAHNRQFLVRPRIIIAVPSGVTQVEKRAVQEAAESAGAREVFLIEEPMAAAMGAALPISDPTCNLIVNIGAGTTEVAVISLGGTVYSRSVRVAGDRMDEAILQHIKREYNLLIGLQTAELVKITVGNAYQTDQVESMEVKGRDLVTGIPKMLTIDSEQVRKIICGELDAITQTVRIALEQTPPELSADVVDTGIFLAGGGALLKNLDVLLKAETQLPVTIADDPLTAVVLGAAKVLDNLPLLKEIALD